VLGGGIVPQGEALLMNGQTFSAAQLRQMEAALGKAGLTQYQIEGMRIRVPHAQQARYMAALAEAQALPANFGDHLKAAVEQNSFLLSGSRQEAQLKIAMQQELQAVINQFQGIESSFVQIAEAESKGFPSTKTITASVSVRPATAMPLEERTASAIRCIVAQSWGGLKPENVTVVDIRSARMFSGPLVQDHTAEAYAEAKKQLESDWQEKIARLLGIPGVVISTNVELAADDRTPRAVSAAIAVPSEYLSSLFAAQRSDRAAGPPDPAAIAEFEHNEHERIKQAILPLFVTADGDANAGNLVSVSTLHTATLGSRQASYERLAVEWLVANWQNVVLGALVVIAILLMRSMFQSSRPTDAAHPNALEIAQSLSLVTDDDQPAQRSAEAVTATTHPQSAELAKQIRRDPQAAASVLKNWIGNAS
jgi:flagellar biosynthesis/type III secretory pathway M-ring protein FliF/YscJ